MSLGGHGIRDIRKNADNQYLIIAGAVDETDSFALYSWDGVPADAPVLTGTTLPAGAADGSWESIRTVPDPLTSGRRRSRSRRTTATPSSTGTG